MNDTKIKRLKAGQKICIGISLIGLILLIYLGYMIFASGPYDGLAYAIYALMVAVIVAPIATLGFHIEVKLESQPSSRRET